MPTNITKKLITLWLFLIIFTLAMPLAVFAVDGSTVPAKQKCLGGTEHNFCLNIQIGRLDGFDVVAGSSIMGDYIKSWYGFLLGTVGILATIMIMWGGFKYLVSRGDKASIESAKTQMISAVTGIVLAFGTYTLLYLINPALLTINTPNLPNIQGGENVKVETGTAGSGVNAQPTGANTCNVPVTTSVIGGVDFGPVNGKGAYATNPCHIANVQGYYNQIGTITSATEAQNFINSKFPNSPVTGQMVWDAATTNNVDARLLMAEMAQDSSMGTAGRAVSTFNPGNVGNDDAGNSQNYGNWNNGVNQLAIYLNTRKPK